MEVSSEMDDYDASAGDDEQQYRSRKAEAFFGRRKTQSLTKNKKRLYDQFLPELLIDIKQAPVRDIRTLFPHMPAQIIMEIGFGAGEHLIHQAKTCPEYGFIGVEPFVNSMAKALWAIEKENLANIRLYNEDAVELLDWLPEGSLDRIDLLYPDPWPKKRHWKRRFVNRKNLTRIARSLKSGGRFHFASDIDSYINWTLQHCHAHPDFKWLVKGPEDWQEPFPNWTRTRYEAKAIREQRVPAYLKFDCL